MSADSTDSKLKQAEIRLRQSEESLLFALDSARMGTWELDLETRRIVCSDMMLEIWGMNRESFSGERADLQRKVHSEDLERMRRAIEDAIERRSIYELEYRIHPVPGIERWIVSRGRCTYDAGADRPSRFAGVVYDITQQKTEALELARLHRISESAVKARDNLISVSAHELLTPISGSRLLLEILSLKLHEGLEIPRDELQKITDELIENQNRLNLLVNDMLDLSRINLGKFTIRPKRVSLSHLIEVSVEHSRFELVSARCDLQSAIAPDVEAEVDAYRIGQIITNLISNACRYASGKPVRIELSRPGPDFARLCISDRGMGIAKKDHARIFERFERATTLDERAGLGLGLFIVKQIVDAHGGSVSVESELGQGARFVVELPLQQGREEI